MAPNLLIEACDDMLMAISAETLQIVEVNARCQQLGYGNDIVGRSILDLQGDLADVFYWTEVTAGSKSERTLADGILLGADGTAMPVTMSVRHVGGYALMHARRRNEDDADDGCAETLAQMRATFESVTEGIISFDLDGKLLHFNRPFARMWGLSADFLMDMNERGLLRRIGHQLREAPRLLKWLRNCLSTRDVSMYCTMQLSDGRVFDCRAQPQTSDDQLLGRVLTLSDITERMQRERDLAAARDAALVATQAKSNFLSTMSHEIRTPMNGILGMAQMLLMPTLHDDDRRDYARIILNSGQTLLALLNDILDISKVDAGKLELELTALEPAQIIHEIQALFAETARHKGLRIESEWAGLIGQPEQHGQRYLGDSHRLRQMLSNLVGNALKFTARGHISIEGREVERNGSHALLEFRVTDTGIGIPEEKQALLFKPFSQADSSTTRQYGGTGLGLSLVRSMARLMGGDVGIESEIGRGSCFWFRIRADLLAPGVDSRDDVRRARVGADDTVTGLRPGAFTGHVLVVDDNPTNRTVLKAMLNRPGVRCDFVEDGQQAVNAITGGMTPDLVLMDCQMPVLDGFEATSRIRRWETDNARTRLPIVALTASAFEDDRKRCIEVGMDDFLAKPIAIEKLTATLAHWLASGSETPRVAEEAPAPQALIAPREDGAPIFDEKTLLDQLGGDQDLAKVVILAALEDMPGYLDQLEQAVAVGSWTAAAMQTHTLKGLTAQIGGIRLSARMRELDDRFQEGGDTDRSTILELRREYQLLSAALLEWIRQLNGIDEGI